MREQKVTLEVAGSKKMDTVFFASSSLNQEDEKYRHLITWGVPALIFLVVILVYMNVLTQGFAFVFWDDNINILNNLHIRQMDEKSLTWMFTDVSYVRRYIPLAWLTWAINYWLGNLNPWGFHAVNVLMHACNAVLLFWLLKCLCEHGFQKLQPKKPMLVAGAAFGALFWALHPLRVEGVAWVTGRIYPQSTLFLLISTLCYVKAALNSNSTVYKNPLYWLSILTFTASLCTHQLAITFVSVLIAIDIYPLNRFGGIKRWSNKQALRIYLEKIPFLGVTLAILGLTYYARIHASGIWEPPSTWDNFPLSARIMQMLYIETYYLWRPWWISGYSPVYTTLVTDNFLSTPFIFSALLMAGLAVAGIILYRKRAAFFLTLLFCHFFLLLPVIGWLEHPHYPCDRYSYVQGILWSVFLCVSWIWLWLKFEVKILQRAIQIVAVAALLMLGQRTLVQQMIWKDSEHLFQHMITTLGNDPYGAQIYWRLGIYYALEKRWVESLRNIDEGIRLSPNAMQLYLKKTEVLKMFGDELFKKGNDIEQLAVIRKKEAQAREMYYRLGGTN